MKELQKYYAAHEDAHEDTGECENQCTAIYLASEADAAFAEMRRERDQAVELWQSDARKWEGILAEMRRENEGLRKQVSDFMAIERQMISDSEAAKLEYKRDADMLIAKHAEEIERLRSQLQAMHRRAQSVESELSEMHSLYAISRLDSRCWQRSWRAAITEGQISSELLRAEEVERLKAEHRTDIDRVIANLLRGVTRDPGESAIEAVQSLRLQAERYEKLRRNLNVKFPQKDFAEFDALIDQLPASGEASAEVQARRTE